VAGGGAGGFFRIEAVVSIGGAQQAIFLAAPRHELPHAGRGFTGHGPREKAGFGLGQMDQLLGNAFFLKDAANQGR